VFALRLTGRKFAKNAADRFCRKFSMDGRFGRSVSKTRMHDFETIAAAISKLSVHHGREFGQAMLRKAATNQRASW
jgi:hypothetical protein